MSLGIRAVLLAASLALAPAAQASQATLVTPGAPLPMAGLAAFLNAALLAVGSGNSGPSAPANGTGGLPFAGERWIDTTTAAAWKLQYYDGTNWIQFGAIDSVGHSWFYNTLQNLIINQNSATAWSVTNTSAGTSAIADFNATNGTGNASVGIGGTGYTTILLLQNRAFINADAGSAGIVINNNGANPTIFSRSNAEVARMQAGWSVGTATDPGAGAILASKTIASGTTTVGSLPTCNAAAKGARYFVTDATAATFHSTVAGGGANNVGVTCDGTNWYIS